MQGAKTGRFVLVHMRNKMGAVQCIVGTLHAPRVNAMHKKCDGRFSCDFFRNKKFTGPACHVRVNGRHERLLLLIVGGQTNRDPFDAFQFLLIRLFGCGTGLHDGWQWRLGCVLFLIQALGFFVQPRNLTHINILGTKQLPQRIREEKLKETGG